MLKNKVSTLSAIGLLSVIPAQAIAQAVTDVTPECVQIISNSLPTGISLVKRDYSYFGFGSEGRSFNLPDYITRIRSGEDEPWSECKELSGETGETYQCGNKVKIRGKIPRTYPMEITVLDRNGRDFVASYSFIKKSNCTLLKVVDYGNGYLSVFGHEDELRKYSVSDVGFTFYALIREFFVLTAIKKPNF